jgi:hypothetical protein
MGTKLLVLDDAEIVRSANVVPFKKKAKNFKKNIKFDFQGYFNMFNGLNRLFEL